MKNDAFVQQMFEYELGNFFDDLENNDFFQCPKCKSRKQRSHIFINTYQAIQIECGSCGNVYKKDLSAENIRKTIKGE